MSLIASAPLLVACLVAGYLFGSIPFGVILTKLAGVGDVRTIGSGNIGATNVLRTGRKDLAAATLLLDGLKGTAAVLLLGAFGTNAAIAAALGAFLGHLFPVWLRFKGGKGVATFLGCILGLFWPVGVLFIATWLVVAFVTRYSSAAALAASALTPAAFLAAGRLPETGLAFVLAAILWYRHRDNIRRLNAGTEGKIGQKG